MQVPFVYLVTALIVILIFFVILYRFIPAQLKGHQIGGETVAALEMIIREIQAILDENTGEPDTKIQKVRELLDGYINANDLHPELVETLTIEEFNKRYGMKITKDQ